MNKDNSEINHEDGTESKNTKADFLASFKQDMASADTLRLDIVAKVEAWRAQYNGDPYGNEEKGKSALVSRDIKRQDEWQHASVKDPFVSDSDIVKCSPITYEDRAAAEQSQLILNYQFTRQFNRYKFMTDVIKLFYSEGTVVTKTSWFYEDEEVMVEMPKLGIDYHGNVIQVGTEKIKQINVITNRPDAEICRLEDVFIDPTCMGDITKAKFVIHRYETDLSTLRSSGKKYKNLKKVAKSLIDADDVSDYDSEDDTEFRFEDVARKKLLTYEYWGFRDMDGDGIAEPIRATWIGDVFIEFGENPLPDKQIPFLLTQNNSTPFKIHGEANAELIGDNQKIATAIKRGILDNMANSNNGQKGIQKGMLDKLNETRFMNGKHFAYNGNANGIYEGKYNEIPASVFSVLSMINNETESMLGVKSFSGGIAGNSLGSTATSAKGTLDAVSVRRMDIVRNIAENLVKPLMRKWMAYNAEFLREEEVIRITNEEFVQIKRDDLKGNIDIAIEVSTTEDNSLKAQELSFLLQTLGQTMDVGMKNLLMGQIAKLNKMPDLAKQLEEYQPQPDPYIEEMKQLEKEKLIAEIEERRSRAMENQVDMENKRAQTALNNARARQINSDADNKNLDYVRTANGQKHREKMDEKDHDRDTLGRKTVEDNVTKERLKQMDLTKE